MLQNYINTAALTKIKTTLLVEALHAEANDPSLELRRNELGLRYLYKLKSNPAYIHTLNTLDDSEDQKYEESERSVKPTGVQLRNLEQRYMEEQKQIEEMEGALAH